MATLLEGLLLVQEPAITGSRLSPFAVCLLLLFSLHHHILHCCCCVLPVLLGRVSHNSVFFSSQDFYISVAFYSGSVRGTQILFFLVFFWVRGGAGLFCYRRVLVECFFSLM